MSATTDLPHYEKNDPNPDEPTNSEKFAGMDNLPIEEDDENLPQFTFRAVAVGCLLGSVISASNFYMGLKLGWTFGASIFGAIFGYSILTMFINATKGRVLNAKEHCALQTAATAAGGGTTAGYITGIPAMYKLGLLTDLHGDLGKIFAWAVASSLYGIFFAIPLRKYFVIKQKLVFPTPTGAANIIKTFHGSKSGSDAAKKQTRVMLICFAASLGWLTLGYFIPVLKIWRFFGWLAKATDSEGLKQVDQWEFYFQTSFAFLGAGMMTSFNNAASIMIGSILGWGVAGPLLLSTGATFEPRFAFNKNVTERPSPRYWLLWPGILIMIASSFTELFCNWRMLFGGIKGGFISAKNGIVDFIKKTSQADKDARHKKNDDDDEDPAPPHEQVPFLWWGSGLLFSIIFTILVMKLAWGISAGETILAVILGFFFAFIGIQSSGETDINPVGAIAKTSQIVLAAVPPVNPTNPVELAQKQTTSLAAGLVAAAAASQATDMVGDLKTGHLLRASPRAQFLAQLVGSVFSVVIGIGFWVLFASAYPCITSVEDLKCDFTLQAVNAWKGVTLALTTKNAIPQSALIAALSLGAFVIVFTIVKNNWIPQKYHHYLINFNSLGVALVNTDQSLIISLFAGAVIGKLWKQKFPENYEMYLFAVASGFIAGEGIQGVTNAVFTLSGLKEGMVTEWGIPHWD